MGNNWRRINQARILEWSAVSFSRDLPDPGIKPTTPMSPDRQVLHHCCHLGSKQSSEVKNLPVNAGDAGSILGQEDALEKEMATHSSILAWKTPWTEEHGGL